MSRLSIMPHALVVTNDQTIADRVSDASNAAGLSLQRSTFPTDLRTNADIVLVGADLAATLARPQLGSQCHIMVVAVGGASPHLWQAAVRLRAEHVVWLPEAESWLVEKFLAIASGGHEAPVVGVLGGRGGAGASTLAMALATTVADEGREPVLVDCDPLGASLPQVLGVAEVPGWRWPDFAGTTTTLSPGAVRDNLPLVAGVRLLTWPPADFAELDLSVLRSVLAAVKRECDVVICDMPRQQQQTTQGIAQLLDHLFLVVPAEVPATYAAQRVLACVQPWAADVRLVVRGPAPTGVSADDIAELLGLPLAGELRAEAGIAAALDRCVPPPVRKRGPLGSLCQRLSDELLAA